MSWVNVRAAIKAKLDTLVPATLGCVLNGEQDKQSVEIPVWPAAELMRVQTDPDYLDNKDDMQSYVFAVNLYYPREGSDSATVEIFMDAIIDAVMQAFLDDATLGGVVNARILPIPNLPGYDTLAGQACRRDSIFLRCRVIKPMA